MQQAAGLNEAGQASCKLHARGGQCVCDCCHGGVSSPGRVQPVLVLLQGRKCHGGGGAAGEGNSSNSVVGYVQQVSTPVVHPCRTSRPWLLVLQDTAQRQDRRPCMLCSLRGCWTSGKHTQAHGSMRRVTPVLTLCAHLQFSPRGQVVPPLNCTRKVASVDSQCRDSSKQGLHSILAILQAPDGLANPFLLPSSSGQTRHPHGQLLGAPQQPHLATPGNTCGCGSGVVGGF
jgi:hypothetical protein